MAQRDMSRTEFLAALERNGFKKPVLFWITSKDDDRTSYGIVVSRKGKIDRRATVAHVIKRRAEHRTKEAGSSRLVAA